MGADNRRNDWLSESTTGETPDWIQETPRFREKSAPRRERASRGCPTVDAVVSKVEWQSRMGTNCDRLRGVQWLKGVFWLKGGRPKGE